MQKRKVTISRNSKPADYPENSVWITVDEPANTASYIVTGIRMRPDELVIEKELFGFFRIMMTT